MKELNKVQQVIKLRAEIQPMMQQSIEHQQWVMQCRAKVKSKIAKLDPLIESVPELAAELNQSDKNQFKTFSNQPPENVQLVMAAAMALFEKNPDWPNAKMIVGHPDFIDNLVKFKWKRVSSKTIESMQKYFTDPNFNP